MSFGGRVDIAPKQIEKLHKKGKLVRALSAPALLALLCVIATPPDLMAKSERPDRRACREVSIEALYENPIAYAGVFVCSEGYIRFHRGAVSLVPQHMSYSELDLRRVQLDQSAVTPLLDDFLTDDLVAVTGYFWVDMDCIEAARRGGFDAAGQPFSCEVPSIPLGLELADAALLERQDLQQHCRQMALDQLMLNAAAHADEWICTQGTIDFVYSEIRLRSSESELGADAREISLPPVHPILRGGDIQSNDQVAITARFSVPAACYDIASRDPDTDQPTVEEYCPSPPEPVRLEVWNLEVLNREADHDACIQVTIETLYTDPLPFQERIVCTEGYMFIEDLYSPHPTVAITSRGYTAEQLREVEISPDLSRETVDQLELHHGDRVRIRGRFGVMEECWESYINGEGCIRPKAPMWIAHPEIELTS